MRLADIFASDLRGAEYIKARGLSPDVVRAAQHECAVCKQNEMLPAVLNILECYQQVKTSKVRRIR